jgi:serine/threonine protein kinase
MGDLFKLLKKNGPLPSTLSHYLFNQILESLRYLHLQKLVHGDLKPENFVISEDFDVKIIDFELCFREGHGRYLGSERYLSPEVRVNNLNSSFKSDLFSLGLILFILILGSPPFVKSTEDDPFYNLFKNNLDGFWNYFEKRRPGIEISRDFKELIEGLLQHDPEKRWGYQEILHNHWVSQPIEKDTAVTTLRSMLT